MTTLLRIDASARTSGSHSRTLANLLEAEWLKAHPGGKVVNRDLVDPVIPQIEDKTIQGYYTPADQMTDELKNATALSDQLIAEVMAADSLLIATPMYNFSLPASLKAWIDQIVRIGVTFGYDAEKGLHGLLENKTAYLVTVAGAQFAGTEIAAMDHLVPYLKTVLGFIDFNKIEVVSMEGTTLDEETFKSIREHAQQSVTDLFKPVSQQIA